MKKVIELVLGYLISTKYAKSSDIRGYKSGGRRDSNGKDWLDPKTGNGS